LWRGEWFRREGENTVHYYDVAPPPPPWPVSDPSLLSSLVFSLFSSSSSRLLWMKHSAGLAHHDLSLENIMLTDQQQEEVTIIDLGMCLRVPPSSSTSTTTTSWPVRLTPQRCRGKAAYVAPEVVREEACDPFASDIWSLAVCLYAMLTGRPLYNSPEDQAFRVMASSGGSRKIIDVYETHGLLVSPVAKDLLCRMLHADPTKRPTLEEVLLHPFLLINTPMAIMIDQDDMTSEDSSTTTTTTSPITTPSSSLLLSTSAEMMMKDLLFTTTASPPPPSTTPTKATSNSCITGKDDIMVMAVTPRGSVLVQ